MKDSFAVKIKQLLAIGQVGDPSSLHLSRQKLIFHFVFAMIEARQVQFSEIALRLSSRADPASSLRRIQRFFAHFPLSDIWLARLIMSWLPSGKLTLCLDRTNWKFGQTDINILALTAAYRGVGVPILFSLLAKKGNSSTAERLDLLQRFVDGFGSQRIGSLMADREFIGEHW